jgi:hypothetical protein
MVAGAMLVASMLALIINTWYSGKILGYGLAKQARDQTKTFLATLVSILPAGYVLYWPRIPKGIAITSAIVIACLLYLSCSMALKNHALKEIRNLLHSIFFRVQSN